MTSQELRSNKNAHQSCNRNLVRASTGWAVSAQAVGKNGAPRQASWDQVCHMTFHSDKTSEIVLTVEEAGRRL